MAKEFILNEGVLDDNVLLIADNGKIFKGGYIAIIKEYVFRTAWSNDEVLKKFKKKERLLIYLNKFYPNFKIDLLE